MTIQVNLPRLHPGQRAMMRGAQRFNVACMGRRFGKTKFGVRVLAQDVLAGYPVGWFAPGYKYVTEVWREAKAYLRPVIASKNEAEKRLELITGGVLEFWTLDGEDPARGRKYRRVVIDEAAMVPELESKWQKAIRPTLTDYRGGAWFLSTPKGRNGRGAGFAKIYDDAGRKPGWARFNMPTTANPFIDPAEVEEARRDLPELVYRQEYLAEFVDFAGLAVKREWLRYEPMPADRGMLTIGMGVDLAISEKETADYTAIVVMAVHRDGRRFVLDAQRGRMSFYAVLQFIRQMAAKWNPAQIRVETAQYQTAVFQELLRTTSLPVVSVKPDKDKLTRFQPLLVRYEQGLVYHVPGILPAFEEELLGFPVGENDDFVDAEVYAEQAAMAGAPGGVATAGRSIDNDMRGY